MQKIPKSVSKIRAVFEDILLSISFREQVNFIRDSLKLPKPTGKIPKNIKYPENGIYKILDFVDKICAVNSLSNQWQVPIMNYIYFGVDGLSRDYFNDSLCRFSDLKEEHQGVWKIISENVSSDDWNEFAPKEFMEMEDEIYPIVLRINPDANIGNIVEYIEQSKKKYELLRKKYKNMNSKIGSKNMSDFFYRKMRVIDLHMEHKKQGEIKKQIEKEFGHTYEKAEIRALISRARKLKV